MLQGNSRTGSWVDMTHYFEIHHKSSDTLDKVDTLDFKGEAIVAVTAYAIAQSEAPIAPHIDHAAVSEIVKKAKLEDMLENVGVWKPLGASLSRLLAATPFSKTARPAAAASVAANTDARGCFRQRLGASHVAGAAAAIFAGRRC